MSALWRARALELCAGLVAATVLTRIVSVERILGVCARWGEYAPRAREGRAVEELEVEELEREALKLAELIPLCNCLDQALALRWFLGRRGIRAVIVVGFKWEAPRWHGHAWLELAEGGSRMLWSSADGHKFKEVTREPVG